MHAGPKAGSLLASRGIGNNPHPTEGAHVCVGGSMEIDAPKHQFCGLRHYDATDGIHFKGLFDPTKQIAIFDAVHSTFGAGR